MVVGWEATYHEYPRGCDWLTYITLFKECVPPSYRTCYSPRLVTDVKEEVRGPSLGLFINYGTEFRRHSSPISMTQVGCQAEYYRARAFRQESLVMKEGPDKLTCICDARVTEWPRRCAVKFAPAS